MSTVEAQTPPLHQRDLPAVSNGGSALVPVRGTLRGKTHLSLGELEAKVEHYPEEARTATRGAQAFFVRHCDSNIERFRALAQERLKVTRSPEYFNNWLKGYYFRGGGGNVRGEGLSQWLTFCAELAAHDRASAEADKLGFIETGTTRAIANHVADILDPTCPCRIAGIAGPTGSQKTASLTLLALKHGFPRAVRIECNSRMSLPAFQRKLANAYNCKVGRSGSALEESVGEELKRDRLVIIHNIQRAYLPGRATQPVFEWLIEMQEEKQFALVLEFKRDFHEKSLVKGEAADYFEQVVGRMGGEANILVLPDATPPGDIKAIARSAGIDSAAGLALLTKWAGERGKIRVLFQRLWKARQIARAIGKQDLTVEILQAAGRWVPPFVLDEEDDQGGAS